MSLPEPATTTTPLGPGTRALLPPCRVCGGKASGCHYGVNSCQGCRMFFRRQLQRSSPPRCHVAGSCEITAKTLRSACVACRFNKCLTAGMVQSSRRTGRYTHALRTSYYEEVQELELQKKLTAQKCADLELAKTCESSNDGSDDEVESLITGLTGLFCTHKQNTAESLVELNSRETQQQAIDKIQHELFGKMRPMLFEDYMEMYYKTGLDIDGRKSWMRRFFPGLEQEAVKFVKFTYHIPGFHKLPTSDQLAVIKAGFLESELMGAYHTFNTDDMTWFPAEDDSFCVTTTDMLMYHNQAEIELLADCSLALQRLDFTPDEHAVLYAYLVLTSGAELSEEGNQQLIIMQDTMADVLYRLLQRNHDDIHVYFPKVISVLLLVRDTVHVWRKSYYLAYHAFSDLDWPPIVRSLLQ